jgi:nucleoside-diphosphate kinase
MSSERTLVLVKPDGVQRGLAGDIIGRIERSGLRISALKLVHMDRAVAERHYAEHVGKPFYEGLVEFITSGPVVAMCVDGPNAIASVRRLMGATDPQDSGPGTIRGDLAVEIGRNLVHGSASLEDAAREVEIFFTAAEIVEYERAVDRWILES